MQFSCSFIKFGFKVNILAIFDFLLNLPNFSRPKND